MKNIKEKIRDNELCISCMRRPPQSKTNPHCRECAIFLLCQLRKKEEQQLKMTMRMHRAGKLKIPYLFSNRIKEK